MASSRLKSTIVSARRREAAGITERFHLTRHVSTSDKRPGIDSRASAIRPRPDAVRLHYCSTPAAARHTAAAAGTPRPPVNPALRRNRREGCRTRRGGSNPGADSTPDQDARRRPHERRMRTIRFVLVPPRLLSTPHVFEVLVNACSLTTMQTGVHAVPRATSVTT